MSEWLLFVALGRPWLWPLAWQRLGWLVWLVLGSLMAITVLDDDSDPQRSLQIQHALAQETLADLKQQLTDKTQQQQQLVSVLPAWSDNLTLRMPEFSKRAQAAGLYEFSMHLTQDPHQASRLHWQAQGNTQALWEWLQFMQQHPWALQYLNIQAGEGQTLEARGVLQLSTVGRVHRERTRGLFASQPLAGFGFDTEAWTHAQRQHAAQHPGFMRWVLPELQRPRQALERRLLSDLRYEGHILAASAPQGIQALVRIIDPTMGPQPIVRVGLGAYLGPNFARVQAITADHVVLRELWLNDQGAWAPRWLRWPLGGGQATVVSSQERQ